MVLRVDQLFRAISPTFRGLSRGDVVIVHDRQANKMHMLVRGSKKEKERGKFEMTERMA